MACTLKSNGAWPVGMASTHLWTASHFKWDAVPSWVRGHVEGQISSFFCKFHADSICISSRSMQCHVMRVCRREGDDSKQNGTGSAIGSAPP